jgi:hypothetical protein
VAKQATRKSKSTKTRAGKSKVAKATTSRKKKKQSSVGKQEVTIDRRSKAGRRPEDVAEAEAPVESKPPQTFERRKKVNRRRQIDPTTCERDYTEPEIEFMGALEQYKRDNGRMFPTCSEVLEVIRSLGYVKLSPAELAVRQAVSTPEPEITLAEGDDDTALDIEEPQESSADFELAY